MSLRSLDEHWEDLAILAKDYPWLMEMADDVEREVESWYVKLPARHGATIHIGDTVGVRYEDGLVRYCCGVGELNGEPCLFWASKNPGYVDGNANAEHDGWDYAKAVVGYRDEPRPARRKRSDGERLERYADAVREALK